MNEPDKGQVTLSAAEVYEAFFIPALFQQWTPRMIEAAQIEPGHRVLDVGCGTGVLARAAAARAGPKGSVVGLDPNEGMLTVATRSAPEVEWRRGRAESLPFDSDSFDAVVSQFALMFFENQTAAIREIIRVARPGARVAIAVWASLEDTPGYAAVASLLDRLFGSEIADALRAPFALGDKDVLRRRFAEAGVNEPEIATRDGTARFSSIESWIYTDVKGWTLADLIDDGQYALLLNEAEKTLRAFVAADGQVAFVAPAHIVTVIKP